MTPNTPLSLRALDAQALTELYPKMCVDFPPDELRPLKWILALLERGIYQPWLVMQGETPLGYAMALCPEGERMVLLDYLAMFPQRRGGGIGTQVLALLKARYPAGIVVEAEAPETAQAEEERTVRRRRCAFYQRAGFRPCPFPNDIFGVTYLVHLWAEVLPTQPERAAARFLSTAYAAQMPRVLFDRQVHITLPPDGDAQQERELEL